MTLSQALEDLIYSRCPRSRSRNEKIGRPRHSSFLWSEQNVVAHLVLGLCSLSCSRVHSDCQVPDADV